MRKSVGFFLPCLSLVFIAGCAIELPYLKPRVSNIETARDVPPITIKIIDKREEGKMWHVSIGPLARKVLGNDLYWYNEEADAPVRELHALAVELDAEFKARKLPVNVVESGDADMILEVKNYQLISMKFTGFDPFIAHHVFYADFIANDGSTSPIPFYFFNGKLPIWSFEKEVAEPCFNIPFSILVKEVAAKINAAVFKTGASTEQVNSIVANVNRNIGNKDVFWDIIALGLTNNIEALPALKEYAGHDDRFIRACALSAIGTLGAVEAFDFLKASYEKLGEADKYLAFKSIGDLAYLGSQEAREYIQIVRGLPKDDKPLAVINYLDNVYKL